MKVSLSWLQEYVRVSLDPQALADGLTMAGLEVDTVEDRYAYLATVVAGRILEVLPHKNADRLQICRVDVGDGELQIVCGAPNPKAGMISPCALPGTRLPDGTVLKEGSIRGERSQGMLCSEVELLLGEDSGGIMALDGDAPVGMPLNTLLSLSDPVFEIDLTPNRPDCLGIVGIAREVAAFSENGLRYPDEKIPTELIDGSTRIDQLTSVRIEAPELCPRYTARLIRDVTVAPSPLWLQDRLLSVGLNPINNIVDITNFVMMETGQPLHAFDFDNLEENRIVVQTAAASGSLLFTTLDGKERQLGEEVLMICDGKKPVGIGGVMGGMNSEIENSTRHVLLESACFNPVSIRKTAKSLALPSDAAHRFERGVDPDGTLRALNRAARLVAELGGGRIVEGTIDENPRVFHPEAIDVSVTTTNNRLGTALNADDIIGLLSPIEFTTEKRDPDSLSVTPPSWRVDVRRFEDVSEEIARRFGYDRIRTTFPSIPAEANEMPAPITVRNRIKRTLSGLGFSEAICYSFISGETWNRLLLPENHPWRGAIRVLNPISEDQAVMRTSLVPGLLEAARRNISLQNRHLKLYETGKVFLPDGTSPTSAREEEMLTGLWSGSRDPLSWHDKETPCDFYDIKGALEDLLAALRLEGVTLFSAALPETAPWLRPGHMRPSWPSMVDRRGLPVKFIRLFSKKWESNSRFSCSI
jgi:phenylalanyl-tRNA synthetase beta chain